MLGSGFTGFWAFGFARICGYALDSPKPYMDLEKIFSSRVYVSLMVFGSRLWAGSYTSETLDDPEPVSKVETIGPFYGS